MAANVETMFYVRETPWHGLGTKVDEALSSAEALKKAGLDWAVIPKPLFTEDGMEAEGFVANVRSSDNKVLGVVSDRFAFVRIQKHLTSPMPLSERALSMKLLEVLPMEKRFGCLQRCREATRFWGMILIRTLCSQIVMMAREPFV